MNKKKPLTLPYYCHLHRNSALILAFFKRAYLDLSRISHTSCKYVFNNNNNYPFKKFYNRRRKLHFLNKNEIITFLKPTVKALYLLLFQRKTFSWILLKRQIYIMLFYWRKKIEYFVLLWLTLTRSQERRWVYVERWVYERVFKRYETVFSFILVHPMKSNLTPVVSLVAESTASTSISVPSNRKLTEKYRDLLQAAAICGILITKIPK